jgi:hypothetical protein
VKRFEVVYEVEKWDGTKSQEKRVVEAESLESALMAHDVPSFAFSRSTKAVEVIGITKIQANPRG